MNRGASGLCLIAYLRTTLHLPLAAICCYLRSLHQLILSVGSIQVILHVVRQAVPPAVDALKPQARQSRILHGDETGWRKNGQNGSIWSFSTPGDDAVRSYEYDRSCVQTVMKRILNGPFTGHLVSDCSVGYHDDPSKHQRCGVHLLRDLHVLKEAHPQDVTVQGWAQAVRAIHDTAKTWVAAHA